MLLTFLMFILEAVEEVFYQEDGKKITLSEKIFTMISSPFWPVYTLIKTTWKQFYAETVSEDPNRDNEEIKELAKLSNRAHLIEVCFESSLQPLIQLHVILSKIIEQNLINKENFDWMEAMTAFWQKDVLTIFNVGQKFNPQVI